MEPIISFKDFSFRYDSQAKPTITNINLDIYPNEKILILGPSGSGKSTLGRCLNGLIPNVFDGEITGEAFVAGQNIKKASIKDLSEKVGTVLQDTSAQFVGLTVAEDVAFILENDNAPKDYLHREVDQWMDEMNIQELAQSSPHDLSGGQKQRVSMAGVLVSQPDILIFDEPLANLDPASGYKTMELIDELHNDHHSTVVIIEHRLEDVLSQAVDRIIVLEKGRIIFNGAPAKLLKENLLLETGIREPLYLSAIKYAGVDLEAVRAIEDVNQVASADMERKLKDWHQANVPEEKRSKEEELLRLENIHFAYESDQPIIKGIDLTVHKQDMISIVGTNGAGKSTLADILAAFNHPQEGLVFYEGQDITEDTIARRAERVGYVMQDPNQMISQHMIFDEVALGLRLRSVDESEIEDRVHQALKTCGLYPFREWPINALSFGQKKRLVIAAILVLEPEILILDEPTAGQDHYHYTEFMKVIRQLNESGMTILMITHNMQLMLEYTDRTLVIHDGQLIADETPFAVLNSEELTSTASLRVTSLSELAKRMNIGDPLSFMQTFIDFEKGAE